MDKSAIEQIQTTALAAAGAAQSRLPTHVTALHTDFTVHNLEGHLPGRVRFRGKLRTDHLTDFVTYVKARGGEGFINAEDLSALVFFNLGDASAPGHADHTALLSMRRTPAFDAMLGANGVARSQRDVIDFIEDWAHVFGAAKDTGDGTIEAIPLTKAIAAIRKVKIEAKSVSENSEGNFKAQQSRLDSVEASSDEGLPDILYFTTAPYFGLPSRTFNLRLSVMTGGDKPTLRFRVVGLEQHVEEIAQQFKAILLEEIGDAASMTIGMFQP